MGKCYIWRDKVDRDHFLLGYTDESNEPGLGYIHIACPIDLDAICEMFGEDVLNKCALDMQPGGEPVEVVLTLTFATEAGSGTVRHG